MTKFDQFDETFRQYCVVDTEMFGKHLENRIFENMLKGDFSDMIKNDNNCEEFKVGYSVETRSYWYQIEFITPKKTTSYDHIIRVYFDADNNELSEILLNKEDFPTVKLDIDNISVVN
jgi:hypothetical protein